MEREFFSSGFLNRISPPWSPSRIRGRCGVPGPRSRPDDAAPRCRVRPAPCCSFPERAANHRIRRPARIDFTDAEPELTIHQGVDLAAPTGTPVPASGRGKGRVCRAEDSHGQHGRYRASAWPVLGLLPHVELSCLQWGTWWRRDIIGTVGMTGFATGPHLHWEVEWHGRAVVPDARPRPAP